MPGMQGAPMLARERETFAAHRTELPSSAPEMFALIHEDEVAGAFGTEMDAMRVGYRLLGNVPFLVEKIEAAATPHQVFTGLIVL